jgi:hypothetical protein
MYLILVIILGGIDVFSLLSFTGYIFDVWYFFDIAL